MKQLKDPRIKIFIAAAVILVVIGAIAIITSSSNEPKEKNTGIPQMKADTYRYNFGDVSMADGLAKHIFRITNEGKGDLKLSNISTSCMCTEAILEINGEKSPAFGMAGHGANPMFWSEDLSPEQSANLEVIFDPNAHGPNATGPVTRTITVYSNHGGKKNQKHIFMFTANVVK